MEALREALALVFGGAPPKGKIANRVGADLVLLVLFGTRAPGLGRAELDQHACPPGGSPTS